MKQKVYIVLGAVVLFTALFLSYNQTRRPLAEVRIGGRWISAEVAASPSSRERGLSGRKGLKEDSGMLFVFQEKGFQAFWMKKMLFPIDIVWIDGQTIVDMAPNVPLPAGADADLPVYRPRAPADFVLEVRAGTATSAGWKIGDGVTIRY